MSKRIIMSLLGSLVASAVVTVGTCGMNQGGDKVTVAVQHPDSCFLLSPKPLAEGLSTTGDIVSVKPGLTIFKFDCDGKQLQVSKEVKEGELTMTVDPTGKQGAPADNSDLGL